MYFNQSQTVDRSFNQSWDHIVNCAKDSHFHPAQQIDMRMTADYQITVQAVIDKVSEFRNSTHDRTPGKANQTVDDATIDKPKGVSAIYDLLRMRP